MEPAKTALNVPLSRDELSRLLEGRNSSDDSAIPAVKSDDVQRFQRPLPESIKTPPAPVVTVPSLDQAIRRARIDAAEQSQGFEDLRSAELARLQLLHDSLEPVFAQLPHGHELFDTGIVPGETPRLFIDMIAFVQMGRDKRTYEFRQDRRDGRVMLAQSADLRDMTKSVTDYIARRLIQREKALAISDDEPGHWPKRRNQNVKTTVVPKPAAQPAPERTRYISVEAPAKPHKRGLFLRTLLFLVEFLGVASLLAALIAAGFFAYLKISGVG